MERTGGSGREKGEGVGAICRGSLPPARRTAPSSVGQAPLFVQVLFIIAVYVHGLLFVS